MIYGPLLNDHMGCWIPVDTRSEVARNANPFLQDCSIRVHQDSESRGQEEASRTRQTSELFTRSTAVKFVDALNKRPLKLSLSYLGLSTF